MIDGGFGDVLRLLSAGKQLRDPVAYLTSDIIAFVAKGEILELNHSLALAHRGILISSASVSNIFSIINRRSTWARKQRDDESKVHIDQELISFNTPPDKHGDMFDISSNITRVVPWSELPVTRTLRIFRDKDKAKNKMSSVAYLMAMYTVPASKNNVKITDQGVCSFLRIMNILELDLTAAVSITFIDDQIAVIAVDNIFRYLTMDHGLIELLALHSSGDIA